MHFNYKCALTPKKADPVEHAISSINCNFDGTLCAWTKMAGVGWLFRSSLSERALFNFPNKGAESSPDYLIAIPAYKIGKSSIR